MALRHHVVLNYVGPDDGEKLQVFYNGENSMHDGSKEAWSYSAGKWKIVIGKAYAHDDMFYSSVQIDELIFFNRALTVDEISQIYSSA